MADLPFTKLPSTWKMERLDRLFRVIKEDAKIDDPPVSAFIDGVVTLRSNRPDAIIKGSGQEIGYKHIEKGDLVISGMNAHLGGLGISDSSGKCTPVYTVLRKTIDLEERYISYYLWHAAKSGYIKSLVNAVRYNSADFGPETVKRFMVPVPPIEEQRRIADYLDQQVPRIDQAVLLFERQLSTSYLAFMLKVEHQTSARLNPADPFRRFRRLGRMDPITSIAGLEGNVTFLGLEDIQPGKLGDFSNTRNVDVVSSGYSRFKSGDILIPKVSPSFGHGRAVVARALVSSVGFASTEVYVFRSNDPGDLDYICGSFRARDFLLAGEATYQGVAGVKRVDRDFILDWPIRWPDKQTRKAVAAKIERGQQDLENLDFKTDVAVASLRALKSSLISAAVTGTFDVTTGRSVA